MRGRGGLGGRSVLGGGRGGVGGGWGGVSGRSVQGGGRGGVGGISSWVGVGLRWWVGEGVGVVGGGRHLAPLALVSATGRGTSHPAPGPQGSGSCGKVYIPVTLAQ